MREDSQLGGKAENRKAELALLEKQKLSIITWATGASSDWLPPFRFSAGV